MLSRVGGLWLPGGGDWRDPKGISLWLLPSGPDQIGEASAHTSSARYIVRAGPERKRRGRCREPDPPSGIRTGDPEPVLGY